MHTYAKSKGSVCVCIDWVTKKGLFVDEEYFQISPSNKKESAKGLEIVWISWLYDRPSDGRTDERPKSCWDERKKIVAHIQHIASKKTSFILLLFHPFFFLISLLLLFIIRFYIEALRCCCRRFDSFLSKFSKGTVYILYICISIYIYSHHWKCAHILHSVKEQ
jgi:hypothetical protein